MEDSKPAIAPTPVKAEIVSVTGKVMPEGLDERGKFKAGHHLSKGNPYTSQIAVFQKCILDSVKQKQLKEVMQAMIKKACEGDVNAARLVFERTCGRLPPEASILMTNVSQGNMIIRVQMQGENDESPLEVRQEQQDGKVSG